MKLSLPLTISIGLTVVFSGFLSGCVSGPESVRPGSAQPELQMGQEVFGGKRETPSIAKVQNYQREAKAFILRELPKDQIEANSVTPLASKFSWRETMSVTPARNQKNCGSCYVFAPVAALEANWAIRHQGTLIDAAEQHVFNCIDGSCKDGGYASDALTFLVEKGTCPESQDKYVAVKKGCGPVQANYKGTARAYVAPDGQMPTSDQLKGAILDHGPVVAFVYAEGFGAYYNSDKVITTDSTGGNHFVIITGWDDTKEHEKGRGAWEIKNSWGDSWGRDGFANVAYGIRDLGYNALWVETVPTAAGAAKEIMRSRRSESK
jgi:C1A family cysteine protease